jgi:hypothetical protein
LFSSDRWSELNLNLPIYKRLFVNKKTKCNTLPFACLLPNEIKLLTRLITFHPDSFGRFKFNSDHLSLENKLCIPCIPFLSMNLPFSTIDAVLHLVFLFTNNLL